MIKRFFKNLFNPRNVFHLDNISAILFTATFFWLMSGVNFEILNPIGDAFSDVELSDVVFSRLGKNGRERGVENEGLTAKLDTNIIIVNVGNLDRRYIAKELQIISSCKPKVIGIDVLFTYPKRAEDDPMNPLYDTVLSKTFQSMDNVVLASEMKGYSPEDSKCDSFEYALPFFADYATNAFVNLETQNTGTEAEKFNVCRSFVPFAIDEKLKDTSYFFTVEITKKYAPDKVQKLLERGNAVEQINFIGNMHRDFKTMPYPRYRVYDIKDIFRGDFDSSHFRNKIVLMGFLGDNLDVHSGEDKFFTPLNPNYVGKADKDMYGVLVHANIISMILSEDYIDEMPKFFEHLIGFLLVYLVFAAFRGIYNDYKVWYDGLTKFLAIILIVVVFGLQAFVFYEWDYKIEIGALYLGAIALSGDLLEIYYGLIKNIYRRIANRVKIRRKTLAEE